MTLSLPLLVVAFAGLLHASFQLGVSLLTLLGGHSLGLGRSHRRLLQLNIAYFLGATVMTVILFAAAAYFIVLAQQHNRALVWLIFALLNIVIGLTVMMFYYRRQKKGTGLWIPTGMAQYLTRRTKKTKSGAEAFTLGAGGVMAEVPFIIGPLGIGVLYTVSQYGNVAQFSGLLAYCALSLASLGAIVVLVSSGSKISTIQRWREDNKLFLQYCAGSGLVILGSFVYVDRFLGSVL